MSTYYQPYKSSSDNIKVELDLTNYATKTDLKNITHTDVSSFASKTNLAALKTEVDKIGVDKLKTVPDDLAKLRNVVKNEVVKKTDFSVDNYVTRTKFSSDTNALDDKIDKVDKKIPNVPKVTESAIKSKLMELLTQLKGFKFVATIVLVFKKIESEDKRKYDSLYSSSKAELIINESDTNDVFKLICTTIITSTQKSLGKG